MHSALGYTFTLSRAVVLFEYAARHVSPGDTLASKGDRVHVLELTMPSLGGDGAPELGEQCKDESIARGMDRLGSGVV
jgi:hypothetical protein